MLLYRLLSVLGLVVYSPYALVRSLTGRRRIGSLKGRLGLAGYPNLSGGIWVHAVSVGEVSVARNLLAALSKRFPGARLGRSCTTVAGLDSARRLSAYGIEVFSYPLEAGRDYPNLIIQVPPGPSLRPRPGPDATHPGVGSSRSPEA